MNEIENNRPWYTKTISGFRATFHIWVDEVKAIFKDRGVMILVVAAPLLYPLLYGVIYKNETLVDVPIAVVDHSRSSLSAELTRKIDATRDLKVVARLQSMHEAQEQFNRAEIHGIIYFPKDFNKNIQLGRQATISTYSNMSSFLYYRAMVLGTNYVVLDANKNIQFSRLASMGINGQQANQTISTIKPTSHILYNSGMGFASFLMPALLILIIHQTLVFAMGMAAGTAREENRFHELVSSSQHHGKIYRVVFGKSMAYFSIYMLLSTYILGIVPLIFNLPHHGQALVMLQFIVPFLLATVFFAMFLSVFNPERETQMLMLLFFSMILLFISGLSWPQSNISGFWKVLSYLFPSTFGIQAYVKINSMGANLHEIRFELIGLWIQTVVYFALATIAYYWQINKSIKKAN